MGGVDGERPVRVDDLLVEDVPEGVAHDFDLAVERGIGGGVGGSATYVSSPPTLGSPSEIWSTPPVIVVDPDTPFFDAVHLLWSPSAVNTSVPEALTSWMSAELLTDPSTPSDPAVLTLIAPEEKMVAGPKTAAAPDADVVCGLLEASVASVTRGVGTTGTPGGTPPKIVRFGTAYPEALPATEVIEAPAGMVVGGRPGCVVDVPPVAVVVGLAGCVVVLPSATVVLLLVSHAVPSDRTEYL